MLREYESGKERISYVVQEIAIWFLNFGTRPRDTISLMRRIWDICTSEAELVPQSPRSPNSERAFNALRTKTRRGKGPVFTSESRDGHGHHVSGFARRVIRVGHSQESRIPCPSVEGTPYLPDGSCAVHWDGGVERTKG